MPETHDPMTQTIAASEARQHFSQLLNQVFRREKRVVIEKSGVPVAALVSADDLEQLRRFEEQRREDFAVLDRIREAFRGVPAEEIEQEVARALAEVRAERRSRANPLPAHR
ncbi:MAG: type II toxin-antitoxin system Phd/YefM family antitoxin [Dehalococcoidia bacterium]